MQDLSHQKAGGYGNIIEAEMWDSHTGGWVKAAVKSISGNFEKEDQMVRLQQAF